MRLSWAARSLLLFGFGVAMLVSLTLLETLDINLFSGGLGERVVLLLLLVVPGLVGIAFSVLSMLRREGKTVLALVGLALNGIFAGFHLLVLSFAG